MLADARILVIGYGRIGRIIARYLIALGVEVTVASRGAECALHRVTTGCYGGTLCEYDAIVNTAPAMVLRAEELRQTRQDCFFLDLASAPGGIDRDAAAELGRRLRWELGLPGRYFPVSAGRIIAGTVLRILTEKGE